MPMMPRLIGNNPPQIAKVMMMFIFETCQITNFCLITVHFPLDGVVFMHRRHFGERSFWGCRNVKAKRLNIAQHLGPTLKQTSKTRNVNLL
jgi:hypothetical protein